MNNPNRYRVSTKFTLLKIFLALGVISMVISLATAIFNQNFNEKAVAYFVGALVLTGFILFLFKTRRVEYDDVECVLYVFSADGKPEADIPVEKIDKILYSAIFFGHGFHSYLIVYRDSRGQTNKVRLFPIAFSRHINTIITDAKLRNPNLVARSWSVGINEIGD